MSGHYDDRRERDRYKSRRDDDDRMDRDREGRNRERERDDRHRSKRSRSRSRERHRPAKREDGDREKDRRRRSRTRSRSPETKRRRSDPGAGSSPVPAPPTNGATHDKSEVAPPSLPPHPPPTADGDVAMADQGPANPIDTASLDSALTPEELQMMAAMGIPFGFDTTQGRHVEVPDAGAVKVKQKREARQYMNRRGGFNRPLPAEVSGQKATKLERHHATGK